MELPDLSQLYEAKEILIAEKGSILNEWVSQEVCETILKRHEIDIDFFVHRYASNVFDYFMGVVSGDMEIGQCPVIGDLIEYLKDKEIRADELFTLCTYLKRSVIDATYRMGVNGQAVFSTISYLFDQNFAGVLKLYTDTIYQKEQEALNASKAKEYFLSNMSHEIRTPLNAILGFVSLLRDETISARSRQYLDIISNSGETLLQIINDILDFSKLRSGEFTVDPQPFNIHDEISHTMELFVPSANSKSITLTSFIDPSIPYEMTADALRIKQIVGNFLSNAIKFTDHAGVIHVEARYEEGILSLSVSDQGIGIASIDQERIFDAFSQAQECGKKIHGGSGLGLSICRQLAIHMGGIIELESLPGEGSVFTLKIPVTVNTECFLSKFDPSRMEKVRMALLNHPEHESYKLESLRRYWEHFGLEIAEVESLDEEMDILIFLESSIDNAKREAIVERQIPSIAILDFLDDRYDTVSNIIPLTFPIYCTKLQSAFSEAMGGTTIRQCPSSGSPSGRAGFEGRVLVAEDNSANQELIRIILERYGLNCTIVSNGVEVYEQFCREPYDIVLMDEQMPVMDGNEATAAILAYESRNALEHTPIVALTANVIKGARERSIQNGYDAFLGKPIVLKEIEQVFERYLQRKTFFSDEATAVEEESLIDMDQLKTALMLEEDQIRQLLDIYRQKMERSLQELHEAIDTKAYEDIAFVAHSIKGSSSNFRFEELSRLAYVIEESAATREDEFDFGEAYQVLRGEFSKRFA